MNKVKNSTKLYMILHDENYTVFCRFKKKDIRASLDKSAVKKLRYRTNKILDPCITLLKEKIMLLIVANIFFCNA